MFTLQSVLGCRACGYGVARPAGIKIEGPEERLIKVVDFGVRPLANDFRKPIETQAGYVPLEILFCPRCKLAQLSANVDPQILYRSYKYVTSNTQRLQDHFQVVFDQITFHLERHAESLLEIGSNDGKFLAFCQKNGVQDVAGVEPDEELSAMANARGCKSLCAFWPDIADDLNRRFDVIVARHVFCHVADWLHFVLACKEVLTDEGLLFIETPYVGDLLTNNQADTIYHEHLSYLNFEAVQALLSRTGFNLQRVERYDLHGGCVGLFIGSHLNGFVFKPENLSVERWKELESQAAAHVADLQDFVMDLKRQGKRIAGYGASAKSSFWIQSCGFRREHLDFICDDTPQKWDRLSPGTDIEIVPESKLKTEKIDYLILYCWNWASEAMERQKDWLAAGGRFIVPVPSVKIVP